MIMVLKQRKIKFFISRIKLNHNICIVETVFFFTASENPTIKKKQTKVGTQQLIRKNEGLEDTCVHLSFNRQ